MSIIRGARPESGWYTLDKRISEDGRLSWAARGLLIFLLGKPDHWRVSVGHLRKQTEAARIRTGRDGVYALLQELQTAGYIEARQERRDDGTLGEMEYIVREISPLPAQPDTAHPLPAQPYPAQTTQVKTDKPSTTDGNKSPCRFEDFWRAYPVKKGKADAQKKWKARGLDAIADQIIEHVRQMQAQDKTWRKGFIPHGSTYINGSRWEDEPEYDVLPARTNTTPAGKTAQGLMALEDFANGNFAGGGVASQGSGQWPAALDGPGTGAHTVR